jgi:hypothetical protein
MCPIGMFQRSSPVQNGDMIEKKSSHEPGGGTLFLQRRSSVEKL